MNNQYRYSFGASMIPPFDVHLTINAERVTVEQFREDLPMLMAEIERYLANSHFNMEKQGMVVEPAAT
jgi:hypothetical protein